MGVSTDRSRAQQKFVDKLGIPYPMLCDVDGEVVRAYGVRGRLGFARRTTFLIDARGRIHKVYPKVSPSTHAAEVLEDLRELTGSQGGR